MRTNEYEEHFIDYAMSEIWSVLDDEEPMTQNRVKVESGTQRIKQEHTRDMGWSGKQATSENTLSSHPERLQRPKGRKREREARTQPDSTDSSTRNVSERERDMGRSGKQVTGENTSSYHPGGLSEDQTIPLTNHEDIRKSKYGMTDFCGKYQMAPEGSLEEAEEWEELARNSLAEMDQSDLESDSE